MKAWIEKRKLKGEESAYIYAFSFTQSLILYKKQHKLWRFL